MNKPDPMNSAQVEHNAADQAKDEVQVKVASVMFPMLPSKISLIPLAAEPSGSATRLKDDLTC